MDINENEEYAVRTVYSKKNPTSLKDFNGMGGVYYRPMRGNTVKSMKAMKKDIEVIATWAEFQAFHAKVNAAVPVPVPVQVIEHKPEPKPEPVKVEPVAVEAPAEPAKPQSMNELRTAAIEAGLLTEEEAADLKGQSGKKILSDLFNS